MPNPSFDTVKRKSFNLFSRRFPRPSTPTNASPARAPPPGGAFLMVRAPTSPVLLFCGDVHAPETLLIDRLLDHPRLFCFVNELRKRSLRRGRATFRQCGGHANHPEDTRHDLGARKDFRDRVSHTRVRTKHVHGA